MDEVFITESLTRVLYHTFATKFVYALLIFFSGFIIGKLLGRLLERGFEKLQLNVVIKEATGVDRPFDKMISSGLTYVIYFATVILALNQIGIALFVVNALSIFVIVLILVLVLLGFKDIVPNAFAGVIIFARKYYVIGDTIKIEQIEGAVTDMDLMNTHVQTKKGDVIHIPHSYVIRHKLKVSK